jgi:predicted nuclease of predicted toxin-antitoxin system
MDVHVPLSITIELRLRGVDVVTAQEDSRAEFKDPELLSRATELGRVLVTQDTGFLREAARRQEQEVPFAGIIYIPQLDVTIGRCVQDLEICARGCEPEEWAH